MSNFRRKTIIPRFLVTIGLGLFGAALSGLEFIEQSLQASLGGLLVFLGAFLYLRASAVFKRRQVRPRY
jgi:hypothetical protein